MFCLECIKPGSIVIAKDAFEAQKEDELSFEISEQLIISTNEDGLQNVEVDQQQSLKEQGKLHDLKYGFSTDRKHDV